MKNKKTIITVLGVRPNIMKAYPVEREFAKQSQIQHLLLHTDQHYDRLLSDNFFKDLNLRNPDIGLNIGSAPLGEQVGKTMASFEKKVNEIKPDMVIAIGDANPAVACSLVASYHHIPVAHIESGLRSFDRTMPEEINRVLTDALSDLLFTPHVVADQNLKKEGIPEEKIHMVGDVMIDGILEYQSKAHSLKTWEDNGLEKGNYAVLTMHRAASVDHQQTLEGMVSALVEISQELPIIFPVHPRTQKNLLKFNLRQEMEKAPNIILVEPLSYLSFLSLVLEARLILTDSGGLQKEASYLNIPCLTMRENTEWTFTLEEGTNRLVGMNKKDILEGFHQVLSEKPKERVTYPCWDGKTGQRIVQTIVDFLE
jgi:UDP-N-acetylglucosamine 2-epimerase (non-hydrolysing)